MPQTRDIALEQLTSAGNVLPIAGTRIDAAHSLGDALAGERPLAELPVAEAIAELVRVEGAVQLQTQADQLAVQLRQRQHELDRREAQLNARWAEFEKEVRDARFWLSERNDALNEREARAEEGSGFRVQGSGCEGRSSDDAETGSTPSVGNPAPSGPCGVPPRVASAETNAVGNAPEDTWSPAAGNEQEAALIQKKVELDRRQAELEKFQEKVSQMHREALQLRLAADESLADLRAALGDEPADEAVALGRQRLAQSFQDEAAELTRLRNELEWLRSEQQTGVTA